MRFSDFYKQGQFRVSFEIFPPKTEEGIKNLFIHLENLKKFNPAYVSVTYGAMGSTQNLTRDLVLKIDRQLGIPAAFHFTCVGSNKESIRSYVEQLKKEGINLVVALRGDPPAGSKTFVKMADGFGNANELVAYLKEIGGFSMAVAGYPEGHVECVDKKTDLDNLKRKVDAGADIVITQLFYDNNDFYDFADRAQKIGIKIPIIPGIMPIVSLAQAEKITQMCGAKIPPRLHERLQKNQNDLDAIKKIGVEHAILQCEGLKNKGFAGIHFYCLNKSELVSKVIEAL